MADKLYRQEWEDAIHDAAVSAAAEWRKYVTDNGNDVTDAGEQNAYEKIFAKLTQEYPYESVKNEDMLKLMNIPSDRIWKWSIAGGNDPRIKQREENLEKFLPLVTGAAQPGEDWQSMDADALKLIAAEKYGYDYTQEGLGEFLKKVGEAQHDYDLAQVNKEMRDLPLGIPGTNIEFGPNGSAYILGSLVYPKATASIDNAVATGGDLTPAQAALLTGIDAGANTAIFASPSANILKNMPVRNSLFNAGLQVGGETARQAAAPFVDEKLEFDPSMVAMAGTAGATRPGMVMTAQIPISRIQGKAAQQISRGIGKATRAGNPALQARDELASSVAEFNKMLLNGELKAGQKLVNLETESRLKGAFDFRQKAEALGVKPNKNGTYNADEILKAYDREPVKLVNITENGITPSEAVVDVGENQVFLTPEDYSKYSQIFGAKVADEMANNKWSKIGFKAGDILSNIGGRVEPTIKINPFAFGPKSIKEYKEMQWYQKLTPEQKKLYDEAMKAKTEGE